MPSSPARALYIHDDPASVGAWCRAQAGPGSLYLGPSAAARRQAQREGVGAGGARAGMVVAPPRGLLALLEKRAGVVPPALLSPATERLLVESCARAADVPLFDDCVPDAPAGAIRAVTRLVRTLRMNRITPGQYAEAGGDPRAAEACERLDRRRAELGLCDEAERVDRLLAAGAPPTALVVEELVLPDRVTAELYDAAIGAARSCHVGLSALLPDGPGEVARHLEALGFTRDGRPEHPRGRADPPRMRAFGGAGMQDEVELVAREMLALLRSRATVRDDGAAGGQRPLRPSDLLGAAPDARYLGVLHDACARLGIPVASPRRVEVLHAPLVRALLLTFRLLAREEDDTEEAGLALLATPYVGLSLDEHDRFASVLVRRGLGALRSWRRFAESTQNARFRTFAEAVPLLSARLEGERSPRELNGVLASLALDHGFLVAGRRNRMEAQREDAVRLDQQGWSALTDTMRAVNQALRLTGHGSLTALRWLKEIESALGGMTVRAEARGVDGVRLTVTGAGLPEAAHLFAVGWREGLVPRRTREDPLLPDRVKQELAALGARMPLLADRAGREMERRERVRRAARESLTISWPATDGDGERLLASFYLYDLGVADRSARSVGDASWPMALTATRAERLTRATVLARHRPAERLGEELAAAREALGHLTPAERRSYDGGMHAPRIISLPASILAEAAPLARAMSASQLRLASHCLYEHFGTHRLRLEPLEAPAIGPREMGEIAHALLAEHGRRGFDSAGLDDTFAGAWGRRFPDAPPDDPRARLEYEMLLGQLRDLIDAERAFLADHPGCRAAHFELGFGLGSAGRDAASLSAGLIVTLPPDAPIPSSTLRGSVDRIDVVERNGVRYGAAIDYKLGSGSTNDVEMKEVADSQLPIYCELLPRLGIEPVGAIFIGIASGERHGAVRADFAADFVGEGDRVRPLKAEAFAAFLAEHREAVKREIVRVARAELVVAPRKDDCGFCTLRPLCRIGSMGAGSPAHE